MGLLDNLQNDFMKGYQKPKYDSKDTVKAQDKKAEEAEPNTSALPRYFQKKGLTGFTPETQLIVNKLKDGQLYGNGFKWFNTLATGAKNDGTAFKVSFLNDLVDQNFALLHELDQHKKQNSRIIEQNDEIINLLQQIASK